MSLLSKMSDLANAIYNDLNQFFDQDNLVPAEIPAFEMNETTALKVKAMETALEGEPNSRAMGGAIAILKNGQPDILRVNTVGEARAVISRIKSGELEIA